MKKLGIWVAMFLGLGILLVAALRPRFSGGAPAAESFAWLPRGDKLPKLFPAPAFSERNQRGETVTHTSLRGRPWVADFIYTQCTSACPMMTSRLVLLQRELAGVDVRFVSFSVDPANDTPDVLAAYARKWNAPETRWILIAPRPGDLKDLVAGFHVTAEPGGDASNRIMHSSVFLLVDAEGSVRGVYDSNDSVALDRLAGDVRRLAPGSRSSMATTEPHHLYLSLGCAGCHGDQRIAPPLEGLHGRDVPLTDGSHVTADDAYLRRSILEPGAQIVAGYPALMPSYAQALSDTQLTELVQEISGMTAPSASASPEKPASLSIDPVCGMTVRVVPETLHATYHGKDVYFCSKSCREAFLAHPEKFEKSGSTHAMP